MNDWQRILLDLRKVFGSCRNIARNLQYRNPDYLTKLSRGEISDPPYSIGSGLIDLYRRHVREEIPVLGQMQQRALIK